MWRLLVLFATLMLLHGGSSMGPSFCGHVEGLTDAKTPVRNLQLICDDDTGHAKISAISFASFGDADQPVPSCSSLRAPNSCRSDNNTVTAAVAKLCIGQRNCILPMGERDPANPGGWPSGNSDPCPGKAKRLFVQAHCSTGVGHALVLRAPPPTPPHPPTAAGCHAALRIWYAAL
eukprot:SAG31_NODE_15194_length_766_cov_1.029985_1_plen_175_part_01